MKKHVIPLLITVAALAAILAFTALSSSAETYSGDCGTNVMWSLDTSTGVLTISGSGAMADYSYSSAPWYSYRSYVKTVTIPNSVTRIGDWAFYDCTGLTTVTIPDSVTSIGGSAFYYCTSLTSVTIGNSVTSIGGSAFYGCYKLVEVINRSSLNITKGSGNYGSVAYYALTVHNGSQSLIERISDFLFISAEDKNYLIGYEGSDTEIVVPDSVNEIYQYAFYNCIGLTSVTIGNGVTSIGGYAFYGCTGLTSVTIPDSVTSIGDSAFYNCIGLTSVNIGDLAAWCKISFGSNNANPLCYAQNLYLNGTLVTDLVIPDGVTSISDWAFNDCTGLTSVTIPDSVTSIGWGAFSDCTGLTSVTIPNSVTSIGGSAFFGCTGLTSVTIGNGVTSIGRSAFCNCTGLTSVTIGNSVTSIGENAFSGCTSLSSVTIPDSVTSIGSEAFYNCMRLTSVHISDVGAWCGISFGSNGANPLYYAHNLYLNDTLVTDLVIPNGVTSIGERAFYYCTGLTSVTIPDSVTSIGDYAFSGCTGLTSVTIGNGVKSIGSEAFYNCTSLTSVTIPDSVTSISDYAFSGCTGLTSVTIPDSVTSIDYYAFYGCTGLTSVTIGNGVTSIGYGAFAGCSGLSAISVDTNNTVYHSAGNCLIKTESKTLILGCKNSVIPDDGSVTSIGTCAFYGCTGLTSVTIPDSVTSIGRSAFYNCTGLTSVTIPDSVTSIGNSTFYGCTGLTSVTIGNGVTSIGYYAFENCNNLEHVYYLGAETRWNNIVIAEGNDPLLNAEKIYDYHVHESDGVWQTVLAATCINVGTEATHCKICGMVMDTREIPVTGVHTWGEWTVTKPATQNGTGLRTRVCARCGETETDVIPVITLEWSVDNYDFVLKDAAAVNFMRIAPGVLTTSSEIRNAPGMVSVDKKLCDACKDENGTLRYNFINAGVYSIWVRFDDGSTYIISGADITNFTPKIGTVNGLTVTVDGIYLDDTKGVKDIWIAKGTLDTYSQCKDAANKIVQITANKIGQADYNYKRSYKYEINYKNASESGDYTVCVRFNEAGRDPVILHFHVDYPQPEIIVNGLQSTVTALEGIKCVRVAPGEWADASAVKKAPGVRVFTAKDVLKNKSEYTIQYRTDGAYTLSIEYAGGYTVVETIQISHLKPTVTVDKSAGTVKLEGLDQLYIIRYAPNPKNSADWSQGYFKQAVGNRYAKTANLTNGMFTTEVLPTLQYKDKNGVYTTCSVWTFMVQYTEESYNIFTVDFTAGTVTWIK